MEGDSQKGAGDDEDVRNETEQRNGLDGKELWGYIACEKWLKEEKATI